MDAIILSARLLRQSIQENVPTDEQFNELRPIAIDFLTRVQAIITE